MSEPDDKHPCDAERDVRVDPDALLDGFGRRRPLTIDAPAPTETMVPASSIPVVKSTD